MFNLTLASPVILPRELSHLAAETGFSKAQLRQLAGGELPPLGIVTAATEEQNLFVILPREVSQNGKPKTVATPLDGATLTRAEAISWLCHQKGIEPVLLEQIDIPATLLSVCTPEQWYDISYLFYHVKSANDRVSRLMTLEAPPIILNREIRSLWDAVEELERGSDEGRIGLKSVGFSLETGWSKEMEDLFDFNDKE